MRRQPVVKEGPWFTLCSFLQLLLALPGCSDFRYSVLSCFSCRVWWHTADSVQVACGQKDRTGAGGHSRSILTCIEQGTSSAVSLPRHHQAWSSLYHNTDEVRGGVAQRREKENRKLLFCHLLTSSSDNDTYAMTQPSRNLFFTLPMILIRQITLRCSTQETYVLHTALAHSISTLILPVHLSLELQSEKKFSFHNSLHHSLC